MDWRRFSVIALVIAILFTVVLLIGQARDEPLVIITSLMATTIAVATPLTLGALSGIFCERAGVVNIGTEGMMLGAAFFGWLAAIYMNTIFEMPPLLSLIIGVIGAILTGGLFALLHAVLSITYNQHPGDWDNRFLESPIILRIGQYFWRKCAARAGCVAAYPDTVPG